MKILYYNLQLGSFDGSNMHAIGMLDALKSVCGNENVVIANNYAQSTYNHKQDQLKLKLSRFLKPFRILRRNILTNKSLKSILVKVKEQEFQPDYVLARSVLYDKTPVLLAQALKCKLIIEHNTPFVYECCTILKTETKLSVRNFESYILKKADGVYVISQTLQSMLKEQYAFMKDKNIINIPNGFIADLFDISKETYILKRNIIRTANCAQQKWIAVFVGSLKSWHGIDNLLNTAELMKDNKEIEFWIIGDGIRRNEIQNYIKLNHNLKWFGNVSFEQLRDLLIAADLGIMPYKRLEKFYFSPLKMFDMIGAKLPFIGLKIGQIEEVCLNNFNDNFCLLNTDPKEIAEKIIYLKNNPEIYQSMKIELEKMWENNTWNSRAKQLVNWMVEL